MLSSRVIQIHALLVKLLTSMHLLLIYTSTEKQSSPGWLAYPMHIVLSLLPANPASALPAQTPMQYFKWTWDFTLNVCFLPQLKFYSFTYFAPHAPFLSHNLGNLVH